MKDMTDRELLDAIDRAMKIVVERFKGRRDSAVQVAHPSLPHGTEASAAQDEAVRPRGSRAQANSDTDLT